MTLYSRRASRRNSATRRLRRVLSATRPRYADGVAPTIADMLQPLGADAAVLSAALLALPFLSPVSLGPISTPISLLIALLGWQALWQQGSTPLPRRLLQLAIPHAIHRGMTRVVRFADGTMLRISRPRLPHLVEGHRGRLLCCTGLIAGAVLLAIPIPLVPLSNTFPALGILLFALALLERDGLLALLGAFALVISAAIFAGLGIAISLLGWEAVRTLIPLMHIG